jgi:hypothetical protein
MVLFQHAAPVSDKPLSETGKLVDGPIGRRNIRFMSKTGGILSRTIISTRTLCRLHGISHGVLRQRLFRNELALAFSPVSPYRDLCLALDAYSIELCSCLQRKGLILRLAAPSSREGCRLWLPMLAMIEDAFELDVIPPVSRQIFFAVTIAVGKHPAIACEMGLDATIAKLAEVTAKDPGDWLPPVGASLSAVLRQLRAAERETGVTLPSIIPGQRRLTLPIDHPDITQFFAEVADYRRAAAMKLQMQARTSKNAARALRAGVMRSQVEPE